MREINEIIVHCSATPESMDIGVKEIRDWHVNDNKWDDIGYHFVIRRDGTIECGRSIDKAGAHCKGHNAHSIGMCLVGGEDADFAAKMQEYDSLHDEDPELLDDLLPTRPDRRGDYEKNESFHNFTRCQFVALAALIKAQFDIFGELPVTPHSAYSSKLCPVFDMDAFNGDHGFLGK